MTARMGLAAAIAMATVFGFGCDSGKDAQILELQRQVADLENENGELQTRLTSLQSGGDAAQRRALQLQALLDECNRANADLKNQLAMRPTIQPEPVRPQGPEGWNEAGGVAWIDLGSDLLFDSGRATLKRDGETKLREIVSTINSRYAGREIWVIGHTDSDPIRKTANLWTDNLHLSQARAATVARELYKLGISPQSVVAGGQGEHNPKAPNTGASKAQNRRVQIVAVERPRASS